MHHGKLFVIVSKLGPALTEIAKCDSSMAKVRKTKYTKKQKPQPVNNFKKYKIKHILKNKDILENSRYESKQDEYMRL